MWWAPCRNMQPRSLADMRGGGRGLTPRVDGEKPFAPLSQAVGREGWIFYTVTTALPFPGEIRDKHGGRVRGGGTGKPALGRRRGREKQGVGHTAWESLLLSGLLKGPYTSPPFLYCHRPLLTHPHLPLQNGSSSCSFVGRKHPPKHKAPTPLEQ